MTTFPTEMSAAQRRTEAPSLLSALAWEYPERSVDELSQIVDQAARVTAALGEWTANPGDYMLALARDRLDARRHRQG